MMNNASKAISSQKPSNKKLFRRASSKRNILPIA